MKSVLRDWVMELPLRHQGVLVAAVRGCDGAPKENSAKPIVRALRYAVLNPADEREVGMPSAFMAPGFSDEELKGFLRDWDHYQVHFIQHLMHACQVVGLCGPHANGALAFQGAYYAMVRKLHLNPETPAEMHARLTEDRIAKYGNATGEGHSNNFTSTEPDPDAPVEVIITTGPTGAVRWETGPSYLGIGITHSPFAHISAAIDDAVDFFHPAPVSPVLRKDAP
jgi:hypothetical protein